MSLLAILYRLVPDSPILVASNREECFDRKCPSPAIQSGKPRILASVDTSTGGTYLGVNQLGMFCSAIPRRKPVDPVSPKSRGGLCREMLKVSSARQAVDLALESLHSGQYRGVNYVVADAESGWVIHAGNEVNVVELEDGLSIISTNDVDDPRDERVSLARRLLTLQMLDSPIKFLAVASKVFSRPPMDSNRPSMVIRNRDYGTVSSTLIALGKKPRDAIYQYANGAPDLVKYEDYSPMLRDILSRGLRESRSKATA
ncbi:MAG TPA: NRDE family protein [Pirellulaceae bacterium]|mgnify:CR=1 FL=1|nr:NRDE family protein [Pirellulaceae bacterium]HMO91066.1 NRDE family protein [Pirellulaceae bacterium]HMP68180.1 NRDE family protein [Pirellulaceae bacterium]